MKTISIDAPWASSLPHPWIIAGPCSAETPDQLRTTAKALVAQGITTLRAGIWKPRTRPGSFSGVGAPALQWIQELKQELDAQWAIEVAHPEHVEAALKAGIDILWIGARSTVNPFTVQEIADSLKGVNIPVLVKNPLNPDLSLWIGALERLAGVGISQLGAIHRGFSAFQTGPYRNLPAWHLPIELKRRLPDLPLLCDPSHIGGDRSLIFPVSQKAMDLNYDGLMIETHPDPDAAWSDAKQQVTPARLQEMVGELRVPAPSSDQLDYVGHLETLREQIDHADRDVLEALARRMDLVKEVGEYKRENNVAILQMDRWQEVFRTRPEWARILNLDADFIRDLYNLVHQASIKQQEAVVNQTPSPDAT
ncbi:MAG: bifunctional 3-deoxy-7-phosphoheptulonate synthase/chorismate mutase type II [Bacteroidota bacterium]